MEAAARQVAVLSGVADGVDVRAALCFVDASGLPLFRRLCAGGIVIDRPRGVARLAKRPGQLDAESIGGLVALLDRRFLKAAP